MSVRALSLVWQHSRHAGSSLLMLLAIADFADDNGHAYPSVSTLAAKCRVRTRAANYTLAQLVDSGELQIRHAKGPKGTNVYRIKFDALGLQSAAPLQELAPLQSNVGTPCNFMHKTPATGCTQTVRNRHRTAATASPSPKAMIFDVGVQLLTGAGKSESGARSLLGRLCKSHGDEVVLNVLQAMTTNPPADPASWLVKACDGQKAKAGDRASASGSAKPAWALKAGFGSRYDAENAGCTERNHQSFRNGKKVAT